MKIIHTVTAWPPSHHAQVIEEDDDNYLVAVFTLPRRPIQLPVATHRTKNREGAINSANNLLDRARAIP